MSERSRRMYVNDIAGSIVTLSPEPTSGGMNHPGSGLGIEKVTVTTTESTPDATFWRTAASCGRFEVTIKAVS